MKDNNFCRLYLINNKDEVKLKYFVTFTYVGEYKEATLESKLNLFKEFIKKLKRKKDFEYFWVSEKETTYAHVHMLCGWEYSFGYVEDEWYKYQNCEKTDYWATKTEDLEKGETEWEQIQAFRNRVSYMFKEQIVHYGISRIIKAQYLKWVKKLDFSTFNVIKNTSKWQETLIGIKFIEKIEGTEEMENEREQLMVEIFNEKLMDPKIIDLFTKINRIYENEKRTFITYIKTAGANVLKWFRGDLPVIPNEPNEPNAINERKFDDNDYLNLWKGLIFYYVSKGLKNTKILHHEYYSSIKTLLYFIKSGNNINWTGLQEVEETTDLMIMDRWYSIAMNIEFYFFKAIKNEIKIEQTMAYREDGGHDIYYLIVLDLKIREKNEELKLFENWKGKTPMVVNPLDWEHVNAKGGYLSNSKLFSIPLVKTNMSSKIEILSGRALQTINQLQSVKFEINNHLLDYIEYNLNDIKKAIFGDTDNTTQEVLINELTGKISKLYHKLNSERVELTAQTKEAMQRTLLFLENKKNKAIEKQNQLKTFEMTLKVARDLANYESFYYMVQVDFRGRIYLVSDYLNYQGSNLAKALIQLKKESKINMYWFKIYCLKKYGYNLVGLNVAAMHKKFDDELSYKMKHYEFNKCWLEAEDKFEFLNCCMEYEKYLIFGEYYKTKFTIYFDATCSGSQLITLLLGVDDYVKDLNLAATTDSDELNDYYLKIIEGYKRELLLKLETHSLLKIELMEKLKNDKDWRKYFKNIIMTVNYGLTDIGMRNKIAEKSIYYDFSEKLTYIIIETFKKYIENISLVKSLNMFTSIVSEITKLENEVSLYTSFDKGFVHNKMSKKEADLKMVQKYNIARSKTIAFDKKPTKLQDLEGWERYRKTYTFFNIDKKLIDGRKQVLAFKANLIHHLDAVWVHSTLLKLFENANFGGICVVHDCFGVNFEDIEILNKTVRLVLIEFFKNNNAYALLYNLNKIKYNVNYEKNNIVYEDKDIEDAILKNLASLGLKNNIDRILQDLELAYYLIFPG